MTEAIMIRQTGGSDVLKLEKMQPPILEKKSVRVNQKWAGVNYVDIYHREGSYMLPSLPSVLGVEAAGIVIEIGSEVTSIRPGDAVAYAGGPVGSYVTERVLPENRLIKIPNGVTMKTAAAAMLKGATAHMVLETVAKIEKGQTVFIHAAAGGLGMILIQWAKILGATTIGTVSSEEKAKLAIAQGLDHAIIYTKEDFVKETKCLTNGKGVDLAIDGIGGETFLKTLNIVKPFGHVSSVGQIKGIPQAISLLELGPKRSIGLSRPSSFQYLSNEDYYRLACKTLFENIEKGLNVMVGQTYELKDAKFAHRDIENGNTTGSILLEL